MLCFGTSDQEDFSIPLADLTKRGLLIAERFRGSYSLTEDGFRAMKELDDRSPA
jgi:hypothetical protein